MKKVLISDNAVAQAITAMLEKQYPDFAFIRQRSVNKEVGEGLIEILSIIMVFAAENEWSNKDTVVDVVTDIIRRKFNDGMETRRMFLSMPFSERIEMLSDEEKEHVKRLQKRMNKLGK
jgi:hypothetical protein